MNLELIYRSVLGATVAAEGTEALPRDPSTSPLGGANRKMNERKREPEGIWGRGGSFREFKMLPGNTGFVRQPVPLSKVMGGSRRGVFYLSCLAWASAGR